MGAMPHASKLLQPAVQQGAPRAAGGLPPTRSTLPSHLHNGQQLPALDVTPLLEQRYGPAQGEAAHCVQSCLLTAEGACLTTALLRVELATPISKLTPINWQGTSSSSSSSLQVAHPACLSNVTSCCSLNLRYIAVTPW